MSIESGGYFGSNSAEEPPQQVDAVVMLGGGVSTVRRNLMEQQGYSPYCGAERRSLAWARTSFDNGQFKCRCGWRSAFEPEFIADYKAKWGK